MLCVADHRVTARYDGFKAGAGLGFDFVAEADAGCDPEKGRKAMEDMITRHKDLDAVFSTSNSAVDRHRQGASRPPSRTRCSCPSTRGPRSSRTSRPGTVIDASVAWSAREIKGRTLIKATVAAARDAADRAKTLVPVTVVSADNAAGWKGWAAALPPPRLPHAAAPG